MKITLFTLVLILSMSVFAKNRILYYEYADTECENCYYVLELDTLNKYGRLVSTNVYMPYLEMHIMIEKIDSTKIIFYPFIFNYSTLDEKPLEGIVDDTKPQKIDRNYSFYDTTDQWNNLIYGYVENGVENEFNSESLSNIPYSETSYFLSKYDITWFPPKMKRIKKINMKKFPPKSRKLIKDNRL